MKNNTQKEELFLMRVFRKTQHKELEWEEGRLISCTLPSGLVMQSHVYKTLLNGTELEIYEHFPETSKIREIVLRIDLKKYSEKHPYWEFSSSDYDIVENIYNEIAKKESHIEDFMDIVLGFVGDSNSISK